MSHSIYQSIEILPSPGEIKQENPLLPATQRFIDQSRNTIREILNQKDSRLLVVVGPCSIHHPDSALEYARRLIHLQKIIGDSYFLVMRVYLEKSRTTTGWKGLLNDPLLDGSEDIATGLRWTRQLLLQIAEMGIPTATEFLDPLSSRYYEDLISWGCIGARTSESQTHRLLASSLSMPIAFKNSTQGCVNNAINGMISAERPHKKLSVDDNGKICVKQSLGNKDLHIALRGGRSAPNYDKDSVDTIAQLLKDHQLPVKILIDCSHDNSPNHESEQEHVFFNVMEQVVEGNTTIRGIILESYLMGGKQTLQQVPLSPEISVTDPCLDWESTEQLLIAGSKMLKKWACTNRSGTLPCAS